MTADAETSQNLVTEGLAGDRPAVGVTPRYNLVAMALHWLIAVAIMIQLASGLWMVEAIKGEAYQTLAYDTYQWHKSLGLTVLVLSILRLAWRLLNRPPALPDRMKPWERVAAHGTHWAFYGFMIGAPLTGWAMVSASPWDLPTIWFGLFEVPHIAPLYAIDEGAKEGVEAGFKLSHEIMGKLGLALLVLHVAAALKHQFIAKDQLMWRMVPSVFGGPKGNGRGAVDAAPAVAGSGEEK
ncbi:MAG: cytochrome b [Pseudomonadota bacterium]